MRNCTHMDESCHTNEWVMAHSWHTITSHIWWQSHCVPWLLHMWSTIYRVTYEWVMSHIWRFHVTRMNESCPTYECVLSHTWMTRYIVPAVWRSHGTQRLLKILFVTWHHCVPWLLHMCDAIYRTSCVKESWHTMCDVTSCQLCEGVMAHSVSLKHCVWRDTIVCHDSSAPTP